MKTWMWVGLGVVAVGGGVYALKARAQMRDVEADGKDHVPGDIKVSGGGSWGVLSPLRDALAVGLGQSVEGAVLGVL